MKSKLSFLFILALVVPYRSALADPVNCTTTSGAAITVYDFDDFAQDPKKAKKTVLTAAKLSSVSSMSTKVASLSKTVCKDLGKMRSTKLFPYIMHADVTAVPNRSAPSKERYDFSILGTFICTASKTPLSAEDLAPCFP